MSASGAEYCSVLRARRLHSCHACSAHVELVPSVQYCCALRARVQHVRPPMPQPAHIHLRAGVAHLSQFKAAVDDRPARCRYTMLDVALVEVAAPGHDRQLSFMDDRHLHLADLVDRRRT